jgi:dihydroorotate dehydrogenase (NAD+) catalytic subunit
MDLSVDRFGVRFRNPVLLAAGTCGFGEEVVRVAGVGGLGGLVTKSVTLEPRWGNPAPRVTEFRAGMMNSVGLANPGADAVLAEKLPWIRDNLSELHVFVSVAGHSPEEYFRIVEILDRGPGFLGFEINLSCPNDTRRSGLPFALDPEALGTVLRGVRERTDRPILAKLAPHTPDLTPVVAAAEAAGANGLTLVNTLPGLRFDTGTGAPVLGAGPGGVSGPALLPVGVHAVWRASQATGLPLVGVGGIACPDDALQYFLAGASLVQIGTASFWDPRAAVRVAEQMHQIGRRRGAVRMADLVGAGRVASAPRGAVRYSGKPSETPEGVRATQE